MSNYTVYHLHSDYSLLDSTTQYGDYVAKAKELGMTAIASTEHGRPLGWIHKKLMCDEAGIKFMHGVEIYLTESLDPKVRDNYHTVLIARNYEGVKEINRLVGLSGDEEHFYYSPRISFDEFLKLSPNVITTSACLASPLNKLDANDPWIEKLLSRYDYLEVQPHNCDEQKVFNERLLEWSKRFSKPLIAGTDTHNISQYKAECRAILLARKHKSYGDEDKFDLNWKTYDELVQAFKTQGALSEEEYLEAIENTNRLADSVEDFSIDTAIKYPILYGSYEEDVRVFKSLTEQMFSEKLASGVIPASQSDGFRRAIEEETEVFEKLGMCGFMLCMSELVRWCKSNGIAIGTARGSVGGSRIAYIIDIIDLNPEQWHTVFSRFANADRKEIGDIDIDCPGKDQAKIFNYITERFGKRFSGRVASFGTIADLSAIDDIGGALREQYSSLNPDEPDSANPWSLAKLAEIKREWKADQEATKSKYPQLFRYYDGIVNTKVSQSVHPAGMVIAPMPLDETIGMFDKDGERCLTVDMDEIHDGTGFAKYDFLGLKTVQVIDETCKLIGTSYPKSHEIDFNDEAVWKDMLKNKTGVFQFESDFAFQSLKQFRPKNIFDMSLVTAAIRPSGMSYREKLLRHVPNHNPSKQIDDLLANNNGYLIYQEDIIAFLQQVCGLTGSEADTVRRGIARKKVEVLDSMLPKILEGYCAKSDKPREEAEEEAKAFLQIIEDASSYMFG